MEVQNEKKPCRNYVKEFNTQYDCFIDKAKVA